MTAREWKPSDVALLMTEAGERVGFRTGIPSNMGWQYAREVGQNTWSADTSGYVTPIRHFVVIDPEDRDQIRNIEADMSRRCGWLLSGELRVDALQATLREIADPAPPKPPEPTDPHAIVTDRRENIWRLLADGDWVCTSGPDIGEYLVWQQLAERGPLSIEATS